MTSARQTAGEVLLYLALLFLGVIIGASVYQRISLIPEWGGNLPDSLIRYFKGTTAAASIGRFWGTCLAPTLVVVFAAIAVNWPDRARRKWLVLAGLLFGITLVWTEVWFVPKGVIPLMVHAGDGMSGAEITSLANSWIFLDWFRMAMSVVAYFSLVKAVTLR